MHEKCFVEWRKKNRPKKNAGMCMCEYTYVRRKCRKSDKKERITVLRTFVRSFVRSRIAYYSFIDCVPPPQLHFLAVELEFFVFSSFTHKCMWHHRKYHTFMGKKKKKKTGKRRRKNTHNRK